MMTVAITVLLAHCHNHSNYLSLLILLLYFCSRPDKVEFLIP